MKKFALLFSLLATFSGTLVSKAQSPEGDKIDLTQASRPGQTKILFIGNSFTFMWDVPGLLTKLAATAPQPKKVFTHRLTWGGQTLSYYYKRIEKGEKTGNAGNLINALDWDYVVLQRWADDDVVSITPKFAEIIRKKNPNTKILLYEWLSDDKKVKGSDAAWLQTQYEVAAKETDSLILPVSWGWKQLKEEKPQWKQVADDGWHPGYNRAYLTACAFYAALFHESPVGLKVREWQTWAPPEGKGKGKVTHEEAAFLQKAAWDAVCAHSNDPYFAKLRK